MKLIIGILAIVGAVPCSYSQTGPNGSDPDSAALAAATQKVVAAQKAVSTATPDAATQASYKKLQWYAAHDKQSKKDAEIAKEKILSKVPGGDDWSPQRGPPIGLAEEEGALGIAGDVAETAGAFLDASTPSNTAGPTLDQGRALTVQQERHMTEQLARQARAQRDLEQALNQENALMMLQPTHAPLKTPTVGPQYRQAPPNPTSRRQTSCPSGRSDGFYTLSPSGDCTWTCTQYCNK
jgi:hypothetical protein